MAVLEILISNALTERLDSLNMNLCTSKVSAAKKAKVLCNATTEYNSKVNHGETFA